MLAVDNSGESPGLTGHTPRQVANNVMEKAREVATNVCLLQFYSSFHGATAKFSPPYISFSISYIYSSFYCLSCSFSLSLTFFFLMLRDDTVREAVVNQSSSSGRKDGAAKFIWLLFTLC